MHKIVRIIFKIAGFASLTVACGILVSMFFIKEPTNIEIKENCKTHVCASEKSQGIDIFSRCLKRCYLESNKIQSGMWAIPVVVSIFFIGIGLILLVIASFSSTKKKRI
jgi:hypothetical protein